jgi:hypothetical protein
MCSLFSDFYQVNLFGRMSKAYYTPVKLDFKYYEPEAKEVIYRSNPLKFRLKSMQKKNKKQIK